MESLSVASIYESYRVQKLGNRKVFKQNYILLPPTDFDKDSPITTFVNIVCALNTSGYVPKNQCFLNVIDKCKWDDSSPCFAADSPALHVPFRTVTDLLGNQHLTKRLSSFLSSGSYPLFNRYTSYCMELSNEKFKKRG